MKAQRMPGAYAYTTREHGQRIAARQVEALEAGREIFTGAGTVRTFSPGTTFTLEGQALLDADAERSFAITRVLHLAHNNLSADIRQAATRALGVSALAEAIAREQGGSLHAVGADKGERPLYRNRIDPVRSKVPYRSSDADGHGPLLHPAAAWKEFDFDYAPATRQYAAPPSGRARLTPVPKRR
ncbi:phage late control D family protein [Rugamonas sp. A1-17]|nr:phage late control D family protein [Rugamonas sp. A1-17]